MFYGKGYQLRIISAHAEKSLIGKPCTALEVWSHKTSLCSKDILKDTVYWQVDFSLNIAVTFSALSAA